MKKNYEKPCCSSMVVAVEQPMLAGSGVEVVGGGFEKKPEENWGNAK